MEKVWACAGRFATVSVLCPVPVFVPTGGRSGRPDQGAPPQIRQRERGHAVAAIGCAADGEQRLVLRNRQERSIRGHPSARDEVACECCDLAKKGHCHAPTISGRRGSKGPECPVRPRVPARRKPYRTGLGAHFFRASLKRSRSCCNASLMVTRCGKAFSGARRRSGRPASSRAARARQVSRLSLPAAVRTPPAMT